MSRSARDPRPSWDEYFMGIAQVVAQRSNCRRRHVGAVIMNRNHILSAGYNGTPRGVKNCFDGGCPRCAGGAASGSHLEECYCVHAEQNAICQAALHGVSIDGATIYVTISPCLTCAKLIINAGIREVVYGGDYAFVDAVKKLFRAAGVKHRKYVGCADAACGCGAAERKISAESEPASKTKATKKKKGSKAK